MSTPKIRGDNSNLDRIAHETEVCGAGGVPPGGMPPSGAPPSGALPPGDIPSGEGVPPTRPESFMDDLGKKCDEGRQEVEYTVSRFIKNPALVADAVSEAISSLIASGGRDSKGELVRNVKGYLFIRARWFAYDALRRSPSDNPQNVSLSDPSREVRILDKTANAFSRRVEEDDLMKVALNALTPDDRKLIHMWFVERMPTRKIAEHLNVSEPTVRNRVRRLCGKMRSAIDGRA